MSEATDQPSTLVDPPQPSAPPTAPGAALAPPTSAEPMAPPLTFELGPTHTPWAGEAIPPSVPAPPAASGGPQTRARRGLASIATALAVPAAAVAVLATFQSWLEVGASERTSYEVVRAAERLHVVSGLGRSTFGLVWAFVPFVLALGLLGLALGRRRAAAGALLAAGLVEASFAALVLRAPGLAGVGARVGLVAGLVLVALAAALLFARSPRSSR